MNLFRTTVAMVALMAALTSADAACAARAYIGTYTPDPADAARRRRQSRRRHLSGEYR